MSESQPGKGRGGKSRGGKSRGGKSRGGKSRGGKGQGGKGQGGKGQSGKGARGQPYDPGRPPGKPSARWLAAGIVRGVLEGRGAARTHLERAFEREDAPERQGLLTELVYGTIRHLGTLDLLLNACAKKGLRQVEESVLSHLRVAAYQLVFLDNVPAAVAVSEAVEGDRREHVRGFMNGLLRQLTRQIERKTEDDTPPLGVESRRRLPGRERGWIVLSAPLLPAAEQDPAGWLAAAASLPRSLAQRWVRAHGLEGALEIARASNAPPPLTLRVNVRRAQRDELLERLRGEGLAVEPGARPESIRLGSSLASGMETLWAGEASVQDETAMLVAPLVDPQPGERVVDLCAAPGGKATHLAELMDDQGLVDAVDVEADRLARVSNAARRLGLSCVRTKLAHPDDPRPEDPEHPPIDRVLVDVPCSNTGVLRRRVEVRWRIDRLDRTALHALQARLLARAVDLVRPGGVIVYSTCSIEHDENQDQIVALLASRDDLVLEREHLSLPRRGGGDGGYVAKLRRR